MTVKTKLRDEFYDTIKLIGGQVNQDKLDKLSLACERLVLGIERMALEVLVAKAAELQKTTHKGFELVAQDVAEIGTRTSQLTALVVKATEDSAIAEKRFGKELTKLTNKLAREVKKLDKRLQELETILTAPAAEAG